MCAHDFARERLCPHARLTQRIDVQPLLLALVHQLALFGRGLVEQLRERAALVLALLDELLVRSCLLIELLLQLLDISLVRSSAVGELGMESIPLFLGALQPGSQLLKVRSALLEKLLELLLRGEGALKRFDRGRGFLERSFDDKHPLTRVGGLGVRGRIGV